MLLRGCEKLSVLRSRRPHPFLDDKVVTAWYINCHDGNGDGDGDGDGDSDSDVDVFDESVIRVGMR